MEKSEIRKKYAEFRNSLSAAEVLEKSLQAAEKILESVFYKEADTVLSYVSIGNEADTGKIISHAISVGKTAGVPLMGKKRGEMSFLGIKGSDELTPNKFGIPEPQYNEKNVINCEGRNVICVVPLLAFDERRYRVGYGGGYYDRFIAANKAVKYVGFCFEMQLCGEIEPNEYDMRLDMIVTEKNVYK